MIEFRHTGIYVDNIDLISDFYINVFDMHVICKNQADTSAYVKELTGYDEILTTKLITPKGKETGSGDMLELVKIPDYKGNLSESSIYNTGTMHIAFGIDDIYQIAEKLAKNGGMMKTSIHVHSNGNKLAFCTDPEGNWIELIERH